MKKPTKVSLFFSIEKKKRGNHIPKLRFGLGISSPENITWNPRIPPVRISIGKGSCDRNDNSELHLNDSGERINIPKGKILGEDSTWNRWRHQCIDCTCWVFHLNDNKTTEFCDVNLFWMSGKDPYSGLKEVLKDFANQIFEVDLVSEGKNSGESSEIVWEYNFSQTERKEMIPM